MANFKFQLGDRVRIVELKTAGRVMAQFCDGLGTQYNVRYFWNGEAKTVYFYEEELEKVDK